MKNLLDIFLKSILAGIMVFFVCCIYINNKNVIGCLFFSVALVVILKQNLKLFTGMMGFCKSCTHLIIAFAGNILAIGVSCSFFRQKINSQETLSFIVKSKLEQNIFALFFSSVICGVLIHTAVLSYKKSSDIISVVLCVAAFVLFGADHCIANACFYALNNTINFTSALSILICAAGNYVGTLVCCYFAKEGTNSKA